MAMTIWNTNSISNSSICSRDEWEHMKHQEMMKQYRDAQNIAVEQKATVPTPEKQNHLNPKLLLLKGTK